MIIRGAAVLVTAMWFASPAQAAVVVTYNDTESYLSALSAAPVDRLGSGNIQWGRAGSAGWEYGVLDAGFNPLQAGQWNWRTANTFLPNAYPLLNYTAAGKLTMAFRANTTVLAAAGQLGSGVDTLTIHSQLTSTGALATVSMANLVLQYSDGRSLVLGDAFANRSGQYITLTDPALARGFKVTYAFGYFNSTDGKELDALPTIEFILGRSAQAGAQTDLPPDEELGSGLLLSRFGDLQLTAGDPLSPVPEPSSWALLLTGFGLAGSALRRRRVAKA